VIECGGDWGIRLECASETAWSAEVRLTRFPNVRAAPDRSVVFYSAGGSTADDAAAAACKAALSEVAGWDPSEIGPATWS